MKENEILAEIHRVRAEHARECNYDVDVIFAEMREDLKRLQAEGWQVVSPAPRHQITWDGGLEIETRFHLLT